MDRENQVAAALKNKLAPKRHAEKDSSLFTYRSATSKGLFSTPYRSSENGEAFSYDGAYGATKSRTLDDLEAMLKSDVAPLQKWSENRRFPPTRQPPARYKDPVRRIHPAAFRALLEEPTSYVAPAHVEASSNAVDPSPRRYVEMLEGELKTLTEHQQRTSAMLYQVAMAKNVLGLQLRESDERQYLASTEQSARESYLWLFQRGTISQLQCETRRALQRAEEENKKLSITVATLQGQLDAKRGEIESQKGAAAASLSYLESLMHSQTNKMSSLVSKVTSMLESSPSRHEAPSSSITREQIVEEFRRAVDSIKSGHEVRAEELKKTVAKLEEAASQAPKIPATVPVSAEDRALYASTSLRACDAVVTLMEMYEAESARKADLARYEMELIRLVTEKQAQIKWQTLYEEKKSEVKHLEEVVQSMRAPKQTLGGDAKDSLAHSTRSSIYDQLSTPYIPNLASKDKKTATATTTKRSIEDLRREALQLGARPADLHPAAASTEETPRSLGVSTEASASYAMPAQTVENMFTNFPAIHTKSASNLDVLDAGEPPETSVTKVDKVPAASAPANAATRTTKAAAVAVKTFPAKGIKSFVKQRDSSSSSSSLSDSSLKEKVSKTTTAVKTTAAATEEPKKADVKVPPLSSSSSEAVTPVKTSIKKLDTKIDTAPAAETKAKEAEKVMEKPAIKLHTFDDSSDDEQEVKAQPKKAANEAVEKKSAPTKGAKSKESTSAKETPAPTVNKKADPSATASKPVTKLSTAALESSKKSNAFDTDTSDISLNSSSDSSSRSGVKDNAAPAKAKSVVAIAKTAFRSSFDDDGESPVKEKKKAPKGSAKTTSATPAPVEESKKQQPDVTSTSTSSAAPKAKAKAKAKGGLKLPTW